MRAAATLYVCCNVHTVIIANVCLYVLHFVYILDVVISNKQPYICCTLFLCIHLSTYAPQTFKMMIDIQETNQHSIWLNIIKARVPVHLKKNYFEVW